MKVTHIKIRKADTPLTVMDSFVDRGLTEGGHASLPDIDVDYASDRRQEIKDYLEERYNAALSFMVVKVPAENTRWRPSTL